MPEYSWAETEHATTPRLFNKQFEGQTKNSANSRDSILIPRYSPTRMGAPKTAHAISAGATKSTLLHQHRFQTAHPWRTWRAAMSGSVEVQVSDHLQRQPWTPKRPVFAPSPVPLAQHICIQGFIWSCESELLPLGTTPPHHSSTCPNMDTWLMPDDISGQCHQDKQHQNPAPLCNQAWTRRPYRLGLLTRLPQNAVR